MENNEITIALTSCGRFDLLFRSVDSLIKTWGNLHPSYVIINEDSGLEIPGNVMALFDKWPNTEICLTVGDRNQILAIDRIYNLVNTGYIFHMECDWLFTQPGFVQPSLDVLENNPNICQVWIRKPNDRNGHPATGQILQTPNRTKYQLMKTGFRGVWNGFSFNPGLRRLSDYQKVGPYKTYIKGNSLDTEAEISKAYLRHGYRAATLLTGYVEHIGQKRGLPK